MKPVVYVTRRFFPEAMDVIGKAAEIRQWDSDAPVPYETLLQQVRSIDGLLCMPSDKIDAAILDAAPRLKVVSNFAVGYDNVDVINAAERGIPVGNTPGVLSETTADLAFALLMAAARRIPEADKYTRDGLWKTSVSPRLMLGRDVHHSTLGIIGMGRIGAEMARRARGFRMHVLYHNRTRRMDVEKELGVEFISAMPELLSRSDFVSLHVPLTGDTRTLIGAAELAMMKPTAILVNTARGQVVDQKALYLALKSGQIAAAALDVFETEPIPADDPLLSLDNVVITPHIGSASLATRTRMAVMAAENLVAGLRGEPLPNCVNPGVHARGS